MNNAVNMEFPGVDYTEKDWGNSTSIVGGDTDICGVMIIAESGPINKPTLVTSMEQAIGIFGGYLDYAFGMYSVQGFFQNGGRKLYISRLAHYSDITNESSLTAKRSKIDICTNTENEITLTFESKYEGTKGNSYGVQITDEHRVSVVTTKSIDETNKNQIEAKVVRDFIVGEWIKISDKTNSEYAQIKSIGVASRILTLTSDLENVYSDGAEIETCDFTVSVYEDNLTGCELKEKFVGCSMDTNSEFYVCSFINDESSYIICTDNILEKNVYESLPAFMDNIANLSGGVDGIDDLTDADIIGNPSSKTGFFAFDNMQDMIHVWCPESHSKEVIRAGYEYWESKKTGMFFSMIPAGLNPDKSAQFRDEAGWDTSYGVLYHNWGYVTDPIGMGSNPQKLIPLTGHVLGRMANHDLTTDDSYGSAPAGESCKLIGVNSLEFDVNSSNGGIMYGNKNRNVNPIVNLQNGGIAIWGARTQSTDSKWMYIHTRRIFIYVEITIVSQTRWMTFRNKTDELYDEVKRQVNKFLRTVKGLRGETESDGFEFVCDSSINDPENSLIIGRLGLNIIGIGEFIWFEFGHKPEGVSLSEV